MKQKNILEVKKLNKSLKKHTERYELNVDNDDYITLWDNSYEEPEFIFKSIELLYVKGFIEGFILGRETIG
jgi:hypothetical protein